MNNKCLRAALMAAAICGLLPIQAMASPVANQVAVELDITTDDTSNYSPGEKVDYKLTMKNKLGPAWIRVHFDLSHTDFNGDFTTDNLNFTDGWVKRGEYYYYTSKAEAYTDYLVVDGFTIPDTDKAGADASVGITVYGDAVQYNAFRPDFSKEEPWEGAEIKHHASSSGGGGTTSAVVGATIHMYSSPQETGSVSTGQWELIDAEKHVWKYKDGAGNYAKNGWIYVANPYSPKENKYDWFHFDADGIMTFGWYKATDTIWYYTHEVSDGNLGMLITGWHDDAQDGKRYYMDEKTGIMLSGWQEIDGKSYYFTAYDETPGQTWFWETGIGKWLYKLIGGRSYGSMYVNEKTPDGTFVGVDGARKEAMATK